MKKHFIILILFLHAIQAQAQWIAKFIDAETNEPISKTYVQVAQNGMKTYDLNSSTDKDGYFKLRAKFIAPRATYHMQIDELKYEHLWQEIDLKRKDTAVIALKRNTFYIPENSKNYARKCGGYMLSHVMPKSARHLEYLPEDIQKKIKEYFIKRVGKGLYEKFNLIDGDIIDYEIEGKDYYIENNKPVYYLCFAYRNLDADIVMYSSNLILGADGVILKDIEFPEIKQSEQDFELISYTKIIEIAIKNDVYIQQNYSKDKTSYRKTEIKLEYLKEENILTWNIVNSTYYDNGTFSSVTSIFDAHTGFFLKEKKTTGTYTSN